MSKRELSLPDGVIGAQDTDDVAEIMRMWWVKDRPEFVINPAMNDPRYVGRMLYEAAFHFSQVYAARDQGNAAELLDVIKSGWQDAHEFHMTTVMTKIADRDQAKPKKK